ncbi:hypothetical protein AVEN_97255-1 [Araneus ventricosus]|uniref:Uncharacterized protein n=1 Tax=Araneus ventricosus TaxID=182803 RepID=A0A4Y2M840_ARAVE|nr:hypothetical protein AVEN_97255-1 [Araneus ventricosus]
MAHFLTPLSGVKSSKRGSRWSSGKVSTSEPNGFQARNPIPLKILLNDVSRVSGLLHANGNSERRVAAQVSSSSSDRGSKLRGSSQNSPHIASKRDINITKI